MTNVDKLVEADKELTALYQEIKEAKRTYISPIENRLAAVGNRANVLWKAVLDEYGSGHAQTVLRAAKAKAGIL